MDQSINLDFEKKIDQAYHYLAKNLRKTGHNSKPVLIHSIMVSMSLYSLGYSKDIVISAILHDLIEDTDIKYADIKESFGKNIADIVNAVSFDSGIKDKIKQTDELFSRITKLGYDAKIVKCADLYSNLPFIKFVDKEEIKKYLIYKYTQFINLFGSDLNNEPIYKLYLSRYNELIKENRCILD